MQSLYSLIGAKVLKKLALGYSIILFKLKELTKVTLIEIVFKIFQTCLDQESLGGVQNATELHCCTNRVYL